MLKRILILVISFVYFTIDAFAADNPPVVVFSKKLTYDKILDIATYEGNVKIEFADYDIITDKMVSTTYKKKGKSFLKDVEFSSKTKIIKKDLSEIYIVPNAVYDGITMKVRSKGDIIIEKDGKFFKTNSIEIDLGRASKVSYPRF
jgi:lipopolysaccharide export system protein LptA